MGKQFYLDNDIDYDGNPLEIDECGCEECPYNNFEFGCKGQCFES